MVVKPISKYNSRSEFKKNLVSRIENFSKVDFPSFKPVIMLTGFVSHIHPSFIDFCNKVCSDYLMDSIPVFVHTWDIEHNNKDLRRFRNYCKKYDTIKLHVITDRFDSGEFLELMSELPYVSIHRNLDIKWISKFYAIHKLSNYIAEKFKNRSIIKVTNRIEFNTEFDSFFNLLKDKGNLWRYSKVNSNLNSENEFLFAEYNYNYINEQQFVISSNLLKNLFGGPFSDFTDKLKKAINKLSDDYKLMSLDFNKIMEDKFYPEGGEVMYRFINNQNPFLYIFKYDISSWTSLLGRGEVKIPSYAVRLDENNTQYVRLNSNSQIKGRLPNFI